MFIAVAMNTVKDQKQYKCSIDGLSEPWYVNLVGY